MTGLGQFVNIVKLTNFAIFVNLAILVDFNFFFFKLAIEKTWVLSDLKKSQKIGLYWYYCEARYMDLFPFGCTPMMIMSISEPHVSIYLPE